jgi:hypothetical protein
MVSQRLDGSPYKLHEPGDWELNAFDNGLAPNGSSKRFQQLRETNRTAPQRVTESSDLHGGQLAKQTTRIHGAARVCRVGVHVFGETAAERTHV